jgi:hypothetical protein
MSRHKLGVATVPPPTFEKRLEVTAASRALIARENTIPARRQAELIALRRDLEQVKQDLEKAYRDWASQSVSARWAGALKYDPNQPRVPAGNPDGGEWTTDDAQDSATRYSSRPVLAARGNQAECDLQYKQDTFICQSVGTPLCWSSAMERYAACLAGHQIPPLRL